MRGFKTHHWLRSPAATCPSNPSRIDRFDELPERAIDDLNPKNVRKAPVKPRGEITELIEQAAVVVSERAVGWTGAQVWAMMTWLTAAHADMVDQRYWTKSSHGS